MVCPPVPAILNLDESDQEDDESDSDLDEETRSFSSLHTAVHHTQCFCCLLQGFRLTMYLRDNSEAADTSQSVTERVRDLVSGWPLWFTS